MRIPQLAPLIVASVMAVSLPSVSHATLLVQSVVNTPLSYTATVEWTAGGNTAVEILGPADLGFTPWSVTLVTSQDASLVLASVQHMVGPHPGDVSPNPNILAAVVLPVTPGAGVGSDFNMVPHPAVGHFDFLNLSVVATSANSSTITIMATHIPEPNSAVLAALGSVALLAGCWRRRSLN